MSIGFVGTMAAVAAIVGYLVILVVVHMRSGQEPIPSATPILDQMTDQEIQNLLHDLGFDDRGGEEE